MEVAAGEAPSSGSAPRTFFLLRGRARRAALVAFLSIGAVGSAERFDPSRADALPPDTACDPTVAACALGANGADLMSSVGLNHPDVDLIGPDGRPEANFSEFSFIGAHYGVGWGVPTSINNTQGVGYCLQEAVAGGGVVAELALPDWMTAADRANASTVMMAFGGDRVIPYAAHVVGPWDVVTGEITDPRLFSAGDGGHTRRRQMSVHLATKQFLGDMSEGQAYYQGLIHPSEAVITGGGGVLNAFTNSLAVSYQMADWARAASPVGTPTLAMTWLTPGGARPAEPGVYPLRVSVADGLGKPLVDMPVLQWRNDDSDEDRSSFNASATVIPASAGASYPNAVLGGWPTWDALPLNNDARFVIAPGPDQNAGAAGTTNAAGFVDFNVTITEATWRLAFLMQAPSNNPRLFGGVGSQNNITWGSTPISVDVADENRLGYFRLNKTSSDATISVEGATFDLRDGLGESLNDFSPTGGVAPANGVVLWSGIDTLLNPGPYQLFELTAPPEFTPPDPDTPLHTMALLSDNPAAPTTRSAENSVTLEQLRIRKVLSGAHDAVGTLAGFRFSVERVEDSASFGELETQSDGQSPALPVPPGTYSICEVVVPEWATAITQSPGCVVAAVGVGGGTVTVDFDYVNVVRRFEAATQIASPVAAVGDVVTDYVWLRDSVPGRVIRAELSAHVVDSEESPVCGSENVVAVGEITTEATGDEQVMGVDFVVPAEASGRALWFAGRVVDAATGTVVAQLPCGDPNERLIVPTIVTTAPVAVDAGADPVARDRYTVGGLPTIDGMPEGWAAEASFELFRASAICDAGTSESVGSVDEVITANGTAETTGGVTVVNAGSAHYFVESLRVTVTRATRPDDSWALPRPGSSGETETIERTIAGAHCAVPEWFPVPLVSSVARERFLVGQPTSDAVTIAGLGDLFDDGGFRAQLTGGLYQHDPSTSLLDRTCTEENLVAPITFEVIGDGVIDIDELPASTYAPGFSYSYAWVLTVDRPAVDGELESVSMAQHGCADDAQTMWAPDVTTEVVFPSPTIGSAQRDRVTVTGLPETVPNGWSLRIVGGLHRFAIDTPLTSRTCTDDNRVASIDFEIDGNGVYATAGEQWSPGFAYSYQERLVLQPENGAPLELGWHGCQEASQAFSVRSPGPQPDAGDSDGGDTTRRRRIPAAGSDLPVLVGFALLCLMCGAGLLIAGRKRRARNATRDQLDPSS